MKSIYDADSFGGKIMPLNSQSERSKFDNNMYFNRYEDAMPNNEKINTVQLDDELVNEDDQDEILTQKSNQARSYSSASNQFNPQHTFIKGISKEKFCNLAEKPIRNF